MLGFYKRFFDTQAWKLNKWKTLTWFHQIDTKIRLKADLLTHETDIVDLDSLSTKVQFESVLSGFLQGLAYTGKATKCQLRDGILIN